MWSSGGLLQDRMRGKRRSSLDFPLCLARSGLILVVHQGDALLGEVLADGVGLGEVLGGEGGQTVGDGGGDVRRLFPALVGGEQGIEAEAQKLQGCGQALPGMALVAIGLFGNQIERDAGASSPLTGDGRVTVDLTTAARFRLVPDGGS